MAYAPEVEAACAANPGLCATLASGGSIQTALDGGNLVIKLGAGTYAGFTVSGAPRVIGGEYTTPGVQTVTINTSAVVLTAPCDLYDLKMDNSLDVQAGGDGFVRDSRVKSPVGPLATVLVRTTTTAAALELANTLVDSSSGPSVAIRVDGSVASLVVDDLTIKDASGTIGISVLNAATVTGSGLDMTELRDDVGISITTGGGTVNLADVNSESVAATGPETALQTNHLSGSITVEGLTYRGPAATFTGVYCTQGAITLLPYPDGSPSVITNALIGIDIANGTLTVKRADISGCGWGMQVRGGTTVLQGVVVHDIVESVSSGASGGGIYCVAAMSMDVYVGANGQVYPCELRDIVGKTFAGAALDGGGIYVSSAAAFSIKGARFLRCRTAASGGKGGAMYLAGSAAKTVGEERSEATGATSGEGGAAMTAGWDRYDSGRVDQGGVEIEDCEAHAGGGISVVAGSGAFTLTNARITGCLARSASTGVSGGGGAIHVLEVNASLYVCLSGYVLHM